MNPGLSWLLRRAPRAWLRSVTRRAQGGKRTVLVLLGGVFLCVVLAGQIPLWIEQRKDPERIAANLASARLAAPLVLTLMLVLIDFSGRGLYFRPAEIDFLFPAPVGRRELLVYHVASRVGVSALSGLWTAVFVVRWAGTVAGGVAAAMLTMVFLQLASQVASLALAALGERFAPRARALGWGLVGALAAAGAWTAFRDVPPGTPRGTAFEAFAASPFVVAATAPAQPFARLFCATGWGDALTWAGACLAELGAMLWLVLALDVAYEEAALASSRRVQEKLRRLRSGEGAFATAASRARRRRVPLLPRLGGAGPVARRQLLELVRNPGSVLWTSGSLLVCVTLLTALGGRDEDDGGGRASVIALSAAFALTTFANQGFTFDFRRDLDRMAELKRLPLRPAVLAAGQLVAPTIVFTLVQLVALGVVVAAASPPAWVVPAALAVLPPWNWLSAALDNALFLVFPYRIHPEDTAKVPAIGRMLLSTMLKTVAIGMTAVAVAVPVAVGFQIGGAAQWAGIAVGWLALASAAAAATFLVAGCFARYDVSADV